MFHLYAYSLQILSYVLYFSFLFPAFLFKFPLEIPPGCLSQYVWNWTYRIPLFYKLISLLPFHLPTAQDWKPESLSAVSSTKTQQFSIVNTMGALPSPIFLFIHSLLKGLLYSSTVLEKMRTNEWVKYQALWSLTYQKSGWWMDRSWEPESRTLPVLVQLISCRDIWEIFQPRICSGRCPAAWVYL